MKNDEIPRKEKATFSELIKKYGEENYRKRLLKSINNLKICYEKINNKRIIFKCDKLIKL